jgi:HK97 family phage major capsid protein
MRKIKVFDDAKQAELAGFWLKALAGDERAKTWCVSRNIGLTKASAEFPDAAGGFIVPEVMDTAILRILEVVGAFRQGAEVRPTTSDASIRPRRTGGLTANYVSEGQTIPESSFTLDAVEASMKKLGILTRYSTELDQESAPDLGEFLTREVAYAFAGAEDDAGFNGDGTSTYRGIQGLGARLTGMKSAVTASHSTFLTLDSTDIANLLAGVMGAAIPGAAWYVSALGYGQTLARLAAVSGGLVARQMPDGTIEANYLGFPVRFSAKLPNIATTLSGLPMMYFGDLRMSSLIVERRQTIIAISLQRAIETDQYLLRGTRRSDLINHDCGTAAAVGPISVLLGA